MAARETQPSARLLPRDKSGFQRTSDVPDVGRPDNPGGGGKGGSWEGTERSRGADPDRFVGRLLGRPWPTGRIAAAEAVHAYGR